MFQGRSPKEQGCEQEVEGWWGGRLGGWMQGAWRWRPCQPPRPQRGCTHVGWPLHPPLPPTPLHTTHPPTGQTLSPNSLQTTHPPARPPTGQALLIAGAVLRDVLRVGLGEALDGSLDGLETALGTHGGGGIVGVRAGAVPGGGRGGQRVRREGRRSTRGEAGQEMRKEGIEKRRRRSKSWAGRRTVGGGGDGSRPWVGELAVRVTHQSPLMGLGANVAMMPGGQERKRGGADAL